MSNFHMSLSTSHFIDEDTEGWGLSQSHIPNKQHTRKENKVSGEEDPGSFPCCCSCLAFSSSWASASILSPFTGPGCGSWQPTYLQGPLRVLLLRAVGPQLPVAQAHSCNLNEQCAKPLKTQLGLSFYCRREEMQS